MLTLPARQSLAIHSLRRCRLIAGWSNRRSWLASLAFQRLHTVLQRLHQFFEPQDIIAEGRHFAGIVDRRSSARSREAIDRAFNLAEQWAIAARRTEAERRFAGG